MADPKILAVSRGTLNADMPAKTPDGHTDVRVIVVSAARVVLVRAVRTFLQAWLGFLGATVVGVIPTDPLAPPEAWQRIVIAAGLALWPAAISVIQNALEIVGRLDVTQPELRG